VSVTERRGVAWRRWVMAAASAGALGAAFLPSTSAFADTAPGGPSGPQAVIVQYGSSAAAAANLVSSVLPRGMAMKALGGLNGVAATLPPQAVSALVADGATVTPDEPVAFQSAGATATSCPSFTTYSPPSGYFPQDSGADQLAAAGDTGRGATVAVLDTGIDGSLPDFAGRLVGGVDLTGGNSPFTDQYGHGTFVAGLIAGNGASSDGAYKGEAPGADLVSIKVAGADGQTSISTIIEGIMWAVAHRQSLGIDVLNLSLGAIPTGPTATEPLDQAVEVAWRAGIAVVVSAGNSGPKSGTILSPGDDPLAITVGAYADNGSPSPANWYACPFSSVGPTAYDGWLKPDLVAPGRSVISVINPNSTIVEDNPNSPLIGPNHDNFVGSGTSFSTAITSGAAALVVAAHPGITPNEVKGRLLGYALPSETQAPLIEGHGFLNAYSAATGPALTYDPNAAVAAEHRDMGRPPTLAESWAASTWNTANWDGSAWTGSAWTGSAWTGSAWNGSAWTGSAWTGSAWTGSSWTGSAWTGSAWTGSAWTGSAWTGSAWTGSAWTGSAWT
jgi:serine protease AprX